jgi:hypothetical protein
MFCRSAAPAEGDLQVEEYAADIGRFSIGEHRP